MFQIGIVVTLFLISFICWDIFAGKRETWKSFVVIILAAFSYGLILWPVWKNQGYPGQKISTEEFLVVNYIMADPKLHLWIIEPGVGQPRNVVLPLTEKLKKALDKMEKKRGPKGKGQPFKGKKVQSSVEISGDGENADANGKGGKKRTSGVTDFNIEDPDGIQFTPLDSEKLPPKENDQAESKLP